MADMGTLFRSLAVGHFTPEPEDESLYKPQTESLRQARRCQQTLALLCESLLHSGQAMLQACIGSNKTPQSMGSHT